MTSIIAYRTPAGCCCSDSRRPTVPSRTATGTRSRGACVPRLQALSGQEVQQLVSDTASLAEAVNTAAATVSSTTPLTYTPGPVEVGWQIWFAAVVSTIPFVIGAYEFGKRIVIQRRCQVCLGSGLVQRGKYQRKCPECGGFFPWVSWRLFLSANARPGNGGPLLQPRGQTSVFYTVPPPGDTQQQQEEQSDRPSAPTSTATRPPDSSQ